MEFINKNPIILIFAGKARSGKDTCVSFVKKYYEEKNIKTTNLQYSTYLKEYAKKINNWDGGDETKPRQLLIDLGTDLIRGKINKDFFVDRMLQDLEVLSYFFDVITISDARLIDELEIPRKKLKKVKVINVIRPNYENGLTVEQKKSLTEIALNNYNNYDYKLVNDGNLEDLEKNVIKMLEEIN